jgi:glycerophosphoryl diester phosphodiesterase
MPHGAPPVAAPRAADTPPLIIAHRGAWEQAPQNSLDAVRQAAALGCGGIEIDVRRTADGQVVVVHNGWLRWRQVGRLDHGQVQARMQVGQAPLLADVLEQASGRLLIDIELKEDGYVPDVSALIADRLAPEQYVVTSFRPAVLAQVRRHLPQARLGLLIGPRAGRQASRRLSEAAADFAAPHVALARLGFLDWAADRRLACWVWTVNEARSIQALGHNPWVAALITDIPAIALRVSRSIDLADSRE